MISSSAGLGAERDELVARGQDRDDRSLPAPEIAVSPTDPSTARSAGRSRRPAGNTRSPAATSSPTWRTLVNGSDLTLDPGAGSSDARRPRAGRPRPCRPASGRPCRPCGTRPRRASPVRPLVARAATAIPSIAAASKAGAERDAKIASAVTRPAAARGSTVSRRERPQAAGAREGLDPGVVRRLDVLAVERHQRSLGEIGGSGAARVRLRHDDAEAGGATALQYLRRPRPPAAGRGRGRRPARGRGAARAADRRQPRSR